MGKREGRLQRAMRSSDLTVDFTGKPYRGKVGKHYKRVKVKLGKKTLVELPELDLCSLKPGLEWWVGRGKRRGKR